MKRIEGKETYIELVHVDQSFVDNCLKSKNPKRSRFALAVSGIQEEDRHFYEKGRTDTGLPDLPPDTVVIVGGKYWELCVKQRLHAFWNSGIKASRSRDLSLSWEDYLEVGNKYIEVAFKNLPTILDIKCSCTCVCLDKPFSWRDLFTH